MPETSFECRICKLHFRSKAEADACYEWCSEHDSCNLEITKHAIERSGPV